MISATMPLKKSSRRSTVEAIRAKRISTAKVPDVAPIEIGIKFKRPTTLGTHQWLIPDLVNAYMQKDVYDYEHNRGSHCFNTALIDKIAHKWDVDGSGIFTFSIENDGRYKVADSHHRLRALVKRHTLGMLSEKDKNSAVTVRLVAPEGHLNAYIMSNTQCGHTSRNKVVNPDLCLGYLNCKVMELLSKKEIDALSPAYFNNLTYVLFAHSKKPELLRKNEWNYAKVFGFRRLLLPFADMPRQEDKARVFNLKQSDFQAVSEAVRFYTEYKQHLLDANIKDKSVKLLFKAAWFGVILTDRLGNQVFTRSAKVLANKCERHMSKLVHLIPIITGSNDSLINTTVGNIAKVLKSH